MKTFELRDILNRSLESGQNAAEFIGAGRPISGYAEMRPADLYMITTSDDAIAGSADALAESMLIKPGTIAFHVSGALPSTVLGPIQEKGGQIASVHPIKSFVYIADLVADFAGTSCGIEGDDLAVRVLTKAFNEIGGRAFPVDSRFKTIYHAGSVLVCNYLTALIETGLRAYQKGGLSRETALRVMEPLVRGTVENLFRVGTVQALTGPIARGDCATVSRQLSSLDDWDIDIALIYRALGRIALDLSVQKGEASVKDLALLSKMLK